MNPIEARALDVEVHRVVFGREVKPLPSGHGAGGLAMPVPEFNDANTGEPVPRYSRDIASAWTVLSALVDRGWSFRLEHLGELRDPASGWALAYVTTADGREVLGAASAENIRHDAAEAICTAAIDAVLKAEG